LNDCGYRNLCSAAQKNTFEMPMGKIAARPDADFVPVGLEKNCRRMAGNLSGTMTEQCSGNRAARRGGERVKFFSGPVLFHR
jgi:hypothetical protein